MGRVLIEHDRHATGAVVVGVGGELVKIGRDGVAIGGGDGLEKAFPREEFDTQEPVDALRFFSFVT